MFISGYRPANLKASLKLLSCFISSLGLKVTFIYFYNFKRDGKRTFFMRSSINFCYSLKYSEFFLRSGMFACCRYLRYYKSSRRGGETYLIISVFVHLHTIQTVLLDDFIAIYLDLRTFSTCSLFLEIKTYTGDTAIYYCRRRKSINS